MADEHRTSTMSEPVARQKPIPKPRQLAPKNTQPQKDHPIYDVPRPVATAAPTPPKHSSTDEQSQEITRERSNSTNSTRPQPKPRRAKSVYVHRTSSSADSSPLAGRSKRVSMHPTPLVTAVTSGLISQIEAQQNRSENKPPSSTETEDTVRPTEDTKPPIAPRRSMTLPRLRAHSEPKEVSPSKPKSRLSKLLSAGQKLISKTPPAVRSTFRKGVTKLGTPFPKRVAPPPPVGASPKRQVPKTQSTPQNFVLPAGYTQDGPEYEDLDRDYEKLERDSSEEENDETGPEGNEYTPPPFLPPKPGGEVPEEEPLPPLPPRSTPRAEIKKHRCLTDPTLMEDDTTNDSKTDSEEEEPTEDTGIYEPVGPLEQNSDVESEESYTDMSGNPNLDRNSDFEDDRPEDVYEEVDANVHIEPPKDYKPKKNRTSKLANKKT